MTAADQEGVIRVRLFASYRESAGCDEVLLDAEEAATVRDAWEALVQRHPGLAATRPSAAVNAVMVAGDTALGPGDEVAFLPPVSGG